MYSVFFTRNLLCGQSVNNKFSYKAVSFIVNKNIQINEDIISTKIICHPHFICSVISQAHKTDKSFPDPSIHLTFPQDILKFPLEQYEFNIILTVSKKCATQSHRDF